jgi:hypothetical protein
MVRNMAAESCLQSISFMHAHKVLLYAVNLRHGTDGITSPPKEVVLRIFITLKNPSSSAGFEPANLGSSGKHATTRPPRATTKKINIDIFTAVITWNLRHLRYPVTFIVDPHNIQFNWNILVTFGGETYIGAQRPDHVLIIFTLH